MPEISRILVPVVFSARCENAARYAAALSCRFHGELTLLHVMVPTWAAYATPEGYATPPRVELENSKERTRCLLDQFLAEELRGVQVRRELAEGDPAYTITDCAASGRYDLIVLPTHGYGPFRRFLLGSVTAKVLHDTHCPVFTGPHLEHPPAVSSPEFRRVLCAIDLGPRSRPVVEWAWWFAQQFAGQLTVVYALPGAAVHLDGVYFDPQWRNDMASQARQRIDSLIAETGLRAEVRIELGDVAPVVAGVAESVAADVVVIGRSQPHRRLGRLRTNAYAIIRESPCPVVAI